MTPSVNITIPVYNEERQLADSIARLVASLKDFRFPYEIVIANNASTDGTLAVAQQLERDLPRVRVVHLARKGRGGALKQVWLGSEAEVLSYMDVDLSTDLAEFPRLIEGVADGSHDLATGSRLLPDARVVRSAKREVISRCYNRILKASFGTHFSDAQCGFKAISRAAAKRLLPLVDDGAWFFDTELLVIAEKLGYRILDLPVRWTEDSDSRVQLLRTAIDDLRGIIRLRRNLGAGKYRPAERMKLRATAE